MLLKCSKAFFVIPILHNTFSGFNEDDKNSLCLEEMSAQKESQVKQKMNFKREEFTPSRGDYFMVATYYYPRRSFDNFPNEFHENSLQ